MRYLTSAKQNIFFSQNGFIEFANAPTELFSEIDLVLQKRGNNDYASGRDLWRESLFLQNFLLKKLNPLLFSLTTTRLRLALDQWIPKGTFLSEGAPFSKLFSIQGFVLGVIAARNVCDLPQNAFGLSPFPKEKDGLLFVKPTLHINWPMLSDQAATDLYFAAFALEKAVYVLNPTDIHTHHLKNFGYQLGDCLNNTHHPFLVPQK